MLFSHRFAIFLKILLSFTLWRSQGNIRLIPNETGVIIISGMCYFPGIFFTPG